MLLQAIVFGVAVFLSVAPAAGHAKLVNAKQEKPSLVLYYSPHCPYCQKVLSYLKKNHKTVPMKNVATDSAAKEELRRYGGKMQVPCLFINNQPLYESDDIIRWMAAHPEALDDA